MAKDAKGHGSEKRGGAGSALPAALGWHVGDAQAANALGQGHPKSSPPQVKTTRGTYTTNRPHPDYISEPGSLRATWNFWVHDRASDGTRWDRLGNTGVPGSRRGSRIK